MNEDLIGVLSQIGFEGFWEDDDTLRCFMKKERWSDAVEEEVGKFIRMLSSPSRFPQPTYSVSSVEDQDWNEEWVRSIKPIQVTGRIVVSPSWQGTKTGPDQIVLIIDPKMSFGTGSHESTRTILVLLEKYLKPGMKLLDVGTGTGILAIAGLKLGAASADAVDVDEWAYRNAIENAGRNGVGHRLRIFMGELHSLPHEVADLITANIQRDVLEVLLDEMAGRLSPGGFLLLSGLLHNDLDPICSALNRQGFTVLQTATENEWVAVAACR